MKYFDPSERVLIPMIISVRADTADVLAEMATEMDVGIDELFSGIAEDAATDLSKKLVFHEDVIIPDKCSKDDLLNIMRK